MSCKTVRAVTDASYTAAVASNQAYTIACIELFSRLWAELERVSALANAPASASRLEIVRLELLIALDACDSMRWRAHLSTSQRLSLRAVLTQVLTSLDASTDDVPRRAIAMAQNRLLESVLDHCRALDALAAGASSRNFPRAMAR